MLKKYFDLFSAYFKENGTMRESCHPGEFVLGLLPLLKRADDAFRPYNAYKELYNDFESQSCEIKYGLGRRTVRLGVWNPSQFYKYMVSNVKPGRLVKKYPTGKYPAFQYWLRDGNLVRCIGYCDPVGEDAEKFYEDAYAYNKNRSTFCVIYDGGFCEENFFEHHEDHEDYHALHFLFWTNDGLGNTVRMFHAYSCFLVTPGEWEINYEETTFDGAEATRLWNAQANPYCEELDRELKNIFREHGLEYRDNPVIDGYSFVLDEYDQNDLK